MLTFCESYDVRECKKNSRHTQKTPRYFDARLGTCSETFCFFLSLPSGEILLGIKVKIEDQCWIRIRVGECACDE